MDKKEGPVLVIGGNGTIGTKLVNYLKERDHEVYISDIQGWDETNEYMQFINLYNFGNDLKNYNIKSVVHLGEYLCMDDPMNPEFINNNLHQFASVLRECGKVGVPVKSVLWSDMRKDLEFNSLYYSLIQKEQIINIYNKGNSAITKIYCPIVVDFDYPASNYYGIFNRILNAFMYGNSVHMDESEYSFGRFKNFISIENTLIGIYGDLFSHNRRRYTLECCNFISPETIMQIFMDILGIEKMEINCGKELLKLTRGDATENPLLTQTIESEIDRLNETLHRLNSEDE